MMIYHVYLITYFAIMARNATIAPSNLLGSSHNFVLTTAPPLPLLTSLVPSFSFQALTLATASGMF